MLRNAREQSSRRFLPVGSGTVSTVPYGVVDTGKTINVVRQVLTGPL